MSGDGLPTPPEGSEWRRADEVVVGDVLFGTIKGRVVAAERKPKTVWITVVPASPLEVPMWARAAIDSIKATIRPRHDECLAAEPRP